MGTIGDFFEEVLAVIWDVLEELWKVIKNAVDWIADHLSLIQILLIVATAGLLYFGWPVIVATYTLEIGVVYATAAADLSFMGSVIAHMGALATAVNAGMVAFATAIHLKLILSVHAIAYMVSSNYRDLIAKLMADISQISYLLGYGPNFLTLLFRSTRNLTLSLSAMFGRQYDIAQITWLTQLNEFLVTFNQKAQFYSQHPERLIWDIEQQMDRIVIDAAGGAMNTFFTLIGHVTESLEATTNGLIDVKTNLNDLVDILPSAVQDKISAYVDPVINKMDSFVISTYNPAIKALHVITDMVEVKVNENRIKADGIVDRLLYPADYLSEIDKMPGDIKEIQEDKIHEISNRTTERAGDIFVEETTEVRDYLADQAVKATLPIVPAAWQGKIVEKTTEAFITLIPTKNTWFVGDY